MFTLPTRTRVKRSSQEVDDAFDPPFDMIYPNIPEPDIVDAQEKPLHPSPAAEMLLNAQVLLPQGEEGRLAKFIRRNF